MKFPIATILTTTLLLFSEGTLASPRGGGGRGGGSSGGRGGSSSSSSGGRSYSSSSNVGGRTRDGSGTPPAYSGKYVGGASVPYTSGQRSPTRSVAPFLLPVTALAFLPAIWLASVYAYPYGYPYHWIDNNGRNRTADVTCLCQEYSVCGCDPQDNQTLIAQLVTGNVNAVAGRDAPVNGTTQTIIDWANGTTIAYVNGTLDNGTTAPGGTDPSNDEQASSAAKLALDFGGYWIAAVVVSGMVMMG